MEEHCQGMLADVLDAKTDASPNLGSLRMERSESDYAFDQILLLNSLGRSNAAILNNEINSEEDELVEIATEISKQLQPPPLPSRPKNFTKNLLMVRPFTSAKSSAPEDTIAVSVEHPNIHDEHSASTCDFNIRVGGGVGDAGGELREGNTNTYYKDSTSTIVDSSHWSKVVPPLSLPPPLPSVLEAINEDSEQEFTFSLNQLSCGEEVVSFNDGTLPSTPTPASVQEIATIPPTVQISCYQSDEHIELPNLELNPDQISSFPPPPSPKKSDDEYQNHHNHPHTQESNERHHNQPFSSGRRWIGKWKLGRTIGEGSSGKVKLAQHMDTHETCVVKAVRRPRLANGVTANSNQNTSNSPNISKEDVDKIHKRELYMIREACMGIMLSHPNIVKLNSAILGQNHFYCFFELVDGEDLVDFISREGALGENRSREIFRKVLSAIEYAHRNHIVHRDIKLENIRYNSVTGVVKILDFGFASFYTKEKSLSTNCGSPCYAAPEIYDNDPYDGTMIDVWSLGVCLFGMITGTLPFDGPDFKTLASKVRGGKVSYPKDLSKGIFKVNSRERSTLDTVLNHHWTNVGCATIPVDYLEHPDCSQEATILIEWVDCIQNASVCQAGQLLMEELNRQVPLKKFLEMDRDTNPADNNATDEEESQGDAEQEAAKFVSNMTIKDKKRSAIWWKRLFRFPQQKTAEEREILIIPRKVHEQHAIAKEKAGHGIAYIVDLIKGGRNLHKESKPVHVLLAQQATVNNLDTSRKGGQGSRNSEQADETTPHSEEEDSPTKNSHRHRSFSIAAVFAMPQRSSATNANESPRRHSRSRWFR